MKIQLGPKSSNIVLIFFYFLLVMSCKLISASDDAKSETFKPNGKKKPPHHRKCEKDDDESACCKHGVSYPLSRCRSPPVSHRTKAILTLNSFERGGDGGGASECDGKFHSDNTLIVALSTGWYNHGKRCLKNIIIHGNGRSVKAKVVDECDSRRGCGNNIVDASKKVWEALGVNRKDWGEMKVHWSDA